MDPCAYMQCGLNAVCRVDSNHKGRCYCPEMYFGNPLVSCERPQCISDLDCPLDLACINQKCQNPCACAPSAICTVLSHVPNCHCPPGYTGNPYESCLIGKYHFVYCVLLNFNELLTSTEIYSWVLKPFLFILKIENNNLMLYM